MNTYEIIESLQNTVDKTTKQIADIDAIKDEAIFRASLGLREHLQLAMWSAETAINAIHRVSQHTIQASILQALVDANTRHVVSDEELDKQLDEKFVKI